MWIRHTVHKRPGAEPTGSLWLTLFDREAGPPLAIKQTLGGARARARTSCCASATSRFGRGEASAHVEADGREAGWDLRFETAEEPLHHLPRGWMYTRRCPGPSC